MNETKTYEELVKLARNRSQELKRYAAVVTVVCYMTEKSYTSVMVGTKPIRTEQRGSNTFIGVSCQFFDGRPLGERKCVPASAQTFQEREQAQQTGEQPPF